MVVPVTSALEKLRQQISVNLRTVRTRRRRRRQQEEGDRVE